MYTLGEKIKRLRINKGETTKHTATAVGLNHNIYKRIEKDEIIVPEKILKRIAVHFEVTVEYLKNEKRIKVRFLSALKNFFLYNNGKIFHCLVALGLIVALVVPIIELAMGTSPTDESIINIITGNHNTVIYYKRTDSILEIVNVSIKEDGEFPMLDIKLRNSGDVVAYLYKMEIVMKDYFQMYNIYQSFYSPAEPSCNYDFVVANNKMQSFDVSQKILGNDTDRFTVTLSTTTGEPDCAAICTFFIRLYYNNDNQYVESGYMTIPINSAARYSGAYIAAVDLELAYQNYVNLCRINKYDAVKSVHFKKIFESYEKNKNSFISYYDKNLE